MDIVCCFGVMVAGCICMMMGAAVIGVGMALPSDGLEGIRFFAWLLMIVIIFGIGLAIILASLFGMCALIACILGGAF